MSDGSSTDYLQIDQINQIDPNLPFWVVVQDLYSTDPTQETCARARRLGDSRPAT